jgi:hypothetical protein
MKGRNKKKRKETNLQSLVHHSSIRPDSVLKKQRKEHE